MAPSSTRSEKSTASCNKSLEFEKQSFRFQFKQKMNYLVLFMLLQRVFGHHYFKCGEGTCLTQSQVCYKNRCAEKCQVDPDCKSGEICDENYNFCRIGCSDSNSYNTYDQAHACAQGYTCHRSRCMKSCREHSNCDGPDQYCHIDHQVCFDRCTKSDHCSQGYQCSSNGQCVKSCQDRQDCSQGQYCHKDGRYCKVNCVSNQDCLNGQFCSQDGSCQSGCSTDNDCPNSKCRQNQCLNPCVQDKNCLHSHYCLEKLCFPFCKSNQDCLQDDQGSMSTCSNGRCIRTCIQDQDCQRDSYCDR